MSSLLQFGGKISRKGVRLEFYLVDEVPMCPHIEGLEHLMTKKARELVPCEICGEEHEQLYVAWRRPVGMFGHWVVFRYLGEEHVPDLSIPIDVMEVPRGAVKLTLEENAKTWHRS